jgi:hypothetical protein
MQTPSELPELSKQPNNQGPEPQRDALGRERSQDRAPTLALPTTRRLRLRRRLANILKRLAQQLSSHSRALDVPVGAHLLRHAIRVVRVNDAVGVVLGAQIALEAEDDDGQDVGCLEGCLDLVEPLKGVVSLLRYHIDST